MPTIGVQTVGQKTLMCVFNIYTVLITVSTLACASSQPTFPEIHLIGLKCACFQKLRCARFNSKMIAPCAVAEECALRIVCDLVMTP